MSTSQDPSGVSYDAAGDLTYDGVNTYLYDGRVAHVSGGRFVEQRMGAPGPAFGILDSKAPHATTCARRHPPGGRERE